MDSELVQIIFRVLLMVFVFVYFTRRAVLGWFRGMSWSEIPEDDRWIFQFYSLIWWGTVVMTIAFIEVVGRNMRLHEFFVIWPLVYLWITRVTMPWFDKNEVLLPWTPEKRGGGADSYRRSEGYV